MTSQMVLVKKVMESISTLYDGLQVYLQDLLVDTEEQKARLLTSMNDESEDKSDG
ncbi:MAG: hypothetical protein IKH92_05055 [Clostridiales bacterium]|nr:hypothetical protein [Clostridiales bacterium]